MPREYGKNWFSMWTDEDFCTGRLFDKLFYQVLLGQSGTNDAGIVPINFRKWRKALRDGDRMPTERDVKASLVRQERRRYVFTDEDTGEVLIRSHIRRDQVFRQPAVMVSALRDLASCQSPKFAVVMLAEMDRIEMPDVKTTTKQGERLRDSLSLNHIAAMDRLRTLAEGFMEPLPEPFTEDFPEELPEPFHRPAETEPSPEGFHRPPVVVEVEVASSPPVGGYVGGTSEPPSFCQDHMPNGTPRPCTPCGEAKRRRNAWITEQSAIAAEVARGERRDQAETRQRAVDNCALCDPDGYLPSRAICDHVDRSRTTSAGLAQVRAALAKDKPDERKELGEAS